MILDTAFFLDLIAGVDGAIGKARAMEAEGWTQRVPAQVVYELYVGVGYTDTPESEVETLSSVLASRPITETTERIAKRAGRMDGRLRAEGERIPSSDLIIGATGIVFDEPVLTRDVDHFERMPGVTVERY